MVSLGGTEDAIRGRVWICDVNGVLVDSTRAIRNAYAATAARYRFRFGEEEFTQVKDRLLTDAYQVLDPSGDSVVRREFHLRWLHEHLADIHAFPGVREVLAMAGVAGIRVGAVTSYGEIAETLLVESDLYRFLDCLVTQEEVRRPKPHPDAILLALALLGRDPADNGDVVHIGDTLKDIQAGRAAGIRTIAVTCGMSTEAELRVAQPDYVLTSFADMRRSVAALVNTASVAS
jgi:pyrophosphatase PpaX